MSEDPCSGALGCGPVDQLQHLALLYTQALICQTSQTAVCNQHHSVEQQFSRWLLMSFDRLHSTKMTITQEQISHLLGVRRETVTQTAGKLQKEGLIAKARGRSRQAKANLALFANCFCMKDQAMREASGPLGSLYADPGAPPLQAWPSPSITQSVATSRSRLR